MTATIITDGMLPLFAAIRKFGDLATVSEVYSPPRVAAQAMTIGLRRGFSVDTSILKPDGTPWNLADDKDFNPVKLWKKKRSQSCFAAARRALPSRKFKPGTGQG